MNAVIDTNVLVSAFIKRGTPPAEVLADLLAGTLVLHYDRRILDEYRKVFARPGLRIPVERATALLKHIDAKGIIVLVARFDRQLPDPTDQPFADVAFTAKVDLLITGNMKDFPVGDSIRLVTPREWVELKRKAREQK